MYHVYILENLKGRLYIGHTDNLERRLEQHNSAEDRVALKAPQRSDTDRTLVQRG